MLPKMHAETLDYRAATDVDRNAAMLTISGVVWLVSINAVALHRARIIPIYMGDRLSADR